MNTEEKSIKLVKKKLILAVVFVTLFMSLSLVSAEPPFEESSSTLGYQIFAPTYDEIKVNTSFDMHIQVSNKSNGEQLGNDVVSCYIHLYNSSGSDTFTSGVLEKESDGFNHRIAIDGANFSDLGEHSFYIWCNNSDFGGQLRDIFEVTNTGDSLTTPISILYFGGISILIFLFVISVGALPLLPAFDERDEDGELIDKGWLKYARPVLMIFGYGILIGIFFLSSNVALAYLKFTMLGKFLFMIYKILYIGALPLFVIWFVWIFYKIFKSKEMKGYLERGVGIGEI